MLLWVALRFRAAESASGTWTPTSVVTAHDRPAAVLDTFAELAEASGRTGDLDGSEFLAGLLEWVLSEHAHAFERARNVYKGENHVSTTKMSDPRDLFLHELGDVLFAEQTLVKALPKLQKEASDAELAKGFGAHLEETRRHVENVKQAFEELGEPAKAEKCPGIEGIKKEHDEFVANESPSPSVLDAFLTGAGARAEHYEIAAYEGLITMAEAMGEKKVAELLTRNLEQEKKALKKMQTFGKRLAKAGAKATAAA